MSSFNQFAVSLHALLLRSVKLQRLEQLAANSGSNMPKTIEGFSTAGFLHLSFNVISEPRCSDIVNFAAFAHL